MIAISAPLGVPELEVGFDESEPVYVSTVRDAFVVICKFSDPYKNDSA